MSELQTRPMTGRKSTGRQEPSYLGGHWLAAIWRD